MSDTSHPATAIDPVCGMQVDIAHAAHTHQYKGTTYYFCSEACMKSFVESPEKYLTTPLTATGSILGTTPEDITGTVWLLGHDLKSPIAIVISTLEMLIALHEGDEALATTVQLMQGALAAANREYNMIGDVLDLARLELHQFEMEYQVMNIIELVEEALESEHYNLTTKKLVLKTNLPDEIILVKVDVELMKRVFSALVDNALKFTVRDDVLEVSVQRNGDVVEIVFADSGRAIFSDFQEAILERAPQWEKRQAGSRTSVGMGLPFVNAVAKAHGGTFTSRSDHEVKKTTFTFTLPISRDTPDDDKQPDSP